MRTYTQYLEVMIEDILMDAEADLPMPACPVFCGTVTVTSGQEGQDDAEGEEGLHSCLHPFTAG